MIFDQLTDEFTYGDLRKCIEEARKVHHLTSDRELLFNKIIWLASSHYELEFSLDTKISERVIFPVSENEKNGIEDAGNLEQYFTYFSGYSEYEDLRFSIFTNLIHKLLKEWNGEEANRYIKE